MAAITAAALSLISASIPFWKHLKENLPKREEPNHEIDFAVRTRRNNLNETVDKAKDDWDKGKVPTSNLPELLGTLVQIESALDLMDYILKKNKGGSTTSELEDILNLLITKLDTLVGSCGESSTGEPSGESSCKEGKHPEKEAELPGYVVRCLLYFSLFPEGYVFNWKRTSRLLIAHEFIKEEKGDATLQQLARKWLQVAERSTNGVPARFMITNNARNEVLKWLPRRGQPSTLILRCHITEEKEEYIPKISDEKYLHSFIVLGKKRENVLGKKRENPYFEKREFMLLRVLSLRKVKLKNENDLKKLSLLRYLDLKYTKVGECKWLEGLEELRMLDLRFTSVDKIPDGVLEKLTNLQHLLLGNRLSESANRLVGAEINTKKLHRENLQTLGAIRLTQEFRIPRKVVDLFIILWEKDQAEAFWGTVKILKELKFLGVAVANNFIITLPDPKLEQYRRLQKLQKLYIEGKISGTQRTNRVSNYDGTPPNLTKLSDFTDLTDLTLASLIPDNSIPRLPKLLCLRLYGVSKEKKLSFGGEGFGNLIKLVIADMKKLESIEVGSDVMNRLTTVKLRDLPQIRKLVSPGETEDPEDAKLLLSNHTLSLESIFLRDCKATDVQRRSDTLNVYCYDANKNCYIKR